MSKISSYVEFIQSNFCTKNGVITSKKYKQDKYSHFLKEIDEYLDFKNIDMGVKLNCILKNELEQKKCKNCGEFITNNQKYFLVEYCSKKCSAIISNNSIQQKEKYKKTCMEKYGVDNTFKSKEIINIIQNKRNSKKDEINNKISNTLKNKDKHSSKYHLKIDFDVTKEYLQNFIKNNKFDCNQFINETGYGYSMISILKTQFNINVQNKNNRTSKTENELANIIPDSIINNKYFISPLEIDVFSEKNKLCIEYNGLLWHSFGKSKYSKFNNYLNEDRNRHLTKTEMVEEKGYQLFHIFENEWLDEVKKKIWVSIINNKLNKNKFIHSRKCIIKEVNTNDKNLFLKENHLQGECHSTINIGLYYKNELVQLMSFNKNKECKENNYDDYDNYELIRCCTKINLYIFGEYNKILKYFEQNYNPKSLITYANRRWCQGKLYEKLNFKFVNNTEPNYFYFKPGEDELLNKSTENEYLYNDGYRKIYDCGNKVYIKEY